MNKDTIWTRVLNPKHGKIALARYDEYVLAFDGYGLYRLPVGTVPRERFGVLPESGETITYSSSGIEQCGRREFGAYWSILARLQRTPIAPTNIGTLFDDDPYLNGRVFKTPTNDLVYLSNTYVTATAAAFGYQLFTPAVQFAAADWLTISESNTDDAPMHKTPVAIITIDGNDVAVIAQRYEHTRDVAILRHVLGIDREPVAA